MLPGAALLVVTSTASPVLARRVRPGYLITAGLAVQVASYLMLNQIDAASGLPLLVAGFIVLYPAVAPSMALTTNLVVGSAPPDKAGAASGLATTCSDLGISIIGSIGAAVYRSQADAMLPAGLPPEVAAASRDILGGAVSAARELPADLGSSAAHPCPRGLHQWTQLGRRHRRGRGGPRADQTPPRPRHGPAGRGRAGYGLHRPGTRAPTR